MAVKKYYSNKSKPGWKENPGYKELGKGKDKNKQAAEERAFYSWGFDYNKKTGRLRDHGFPTKELATAALARVVLAEKNDKYDLITKDKTPFPTVAELRQKRIASMPERKEQQVTLRVLTEIEMLIEKRTGKHTPRIDDITVGVVNDYVSKRRTENVSDATINRELNTIRAAFGQVTSFWGKDELPEWKPPKITACKVPRTRRERVVSSSESRAILFNLLKPKRESESIDRYYSRRRTGLMFLLASITGARPGELVRLRQSDILPDIQKLRIYGHKIRYAKSRVVRYFPLFDAVKKLLAEAIEIQQGDYIFSRKGTITRTYYMPLKEACEAAGIVYGRYADGGMITYDMRHTATTLLAQSGADIETISSITGQSHDSIWHYLHASKESIARATGELEKFGNKILSEGLRLDTKFEANP